MAQNRPPVLGVPVNRMPAQPAPRPRAGEAPNRANSKPIRLFNQMVWYTQSGLYANELTNDGLLQFARTKGTLLEYSIGNELHTDPADPLRIHHKHAFLKYSKPISMRDSRYSDMFDMPGLNARVLHPHIEPVGKTTQDKHTVVAYSQKDGDYIASPHLMNADINRYQDDWPEKINNADSAQEALKMLRVDHPQIFYLHGTRILPMLDISHGQNDAVNFSRADFSLQIDPAELRQKAVVLYGDSGIGKTSCALAQFPRPLLVSRMEDLKKISLRTTHLVFDEMRFDGRDDDTAGRESKLSPQELIKLLDVEHNRSISARYKDAQIPKGMPRIFTTNSPLLPHDHFFPRGRDAVEQYAIDSRYIKKGWLANDIRDDAMHAARRPRLGP